MHTPRLKTKLFALTATTALAFVAFAANNKGLKPGDPFPDLAEFKLEGKLPNALKGQVVFVDFWASWCGPCAKSFPAINELHQIYKDRGVTFIAVNVDEKREAMEKFLGKYSAAFPVVRDAEHKLVAELDVATMPTSFILDREGKVRFIHNGFHGDATRKQYAEEIESLLNKP